MRALLHSVLRHRRVLAALTVTLGFLLTAARADAQFIDWTGEGDGFHTFGPNQTVAISLGALGSNACDPFFQTADVYVVLGNTTALGGTPNTIVSPASGGLFIDETIAFTAPGGNLGPGVYGVVFDQCQDGVFTPGEDTLFYPAFEVVIPANVPVLPSPSIAALKSAAAAEAIRWKIVGKFMTIAEALAKKQLKYLKKAKKWGILSALGLQHPMDVVKDAIADQVAHYHGIAEDPPDPAFQQSDPLAPTPPILPDSNEPIHRAMVALGNASASEDALLGSLLHAIERYQGADAADRSDWARVHAQSIKALSGNLIDQLSSTNTALTAFNAAIAADPRDLDALAAALEADRARIATTGFDAAELQELRNLGMTAAEIAALRADIADDEPSNFTRANVQSAVNDILAANVDLTSAASSLSSDMDSLITTLDAPPNFPSGRPVAEAGGPYAATEGLAVALSGSGTDDAGISSYGWDLDRDGQFDDATGASPTVTFPAAFNGFIGLQVTDGAGNTAVDFAYVTVTDVNQPPTIIDALPTALTQELQAGNSLAFSIGTSDPDGDPVSVRWLVDFVEVATGNTFTYSPAMGGIGLHYIRAEANDNNAAGGFVTLDWEVSVLAPDLDGDGWNSTADCNDADASIHPGHPEVVGNGKDDDCNPLTLDTGLPPVASFATAPPVGVAGQAMAFADQSTDPDSAIVAWAWTFGDGTTSNDQNPAHTYAAAGNYTAGLTVTDQHGNTNGTTRPVRVFGSSSDAVSISFVINELDCPDGWWSFPLVHNFYIGNTLVGSSPSPHGCNDNSTPLVFTLDDTTDPAGSFRALAADDACVLYKVDTIGGGARVSYERVDVVRAGVPPTSTCVFDASSSWGGWGLSHCEARATNAQATLNGNQTHASASDVDADGTRDSCDTDLDGDGVANDADNCPYVVNPGQELSGPNSGAGAPGDACRDTDSDGVRDVNDNCSVDYNPNQANNDADAQGDVCDTDDDNDTVLDGTDNCVFTPNTNQSDIDFDNIGDVCDQDMDGDGQYNWSDNCVTTPNYDQRNSDGDAQGDACDADKDNDAVPNAIDNCPTLGNGDQSDSDGNGVGNVCETRIITVPWLGAKEQPHQVYTGGRLTLQGVAVTSAFLPGFITSATWDPGDGSLPEVIDITNPLILELQHVYSGAPGTPYTATLSATTVTGAIISDTFKVVIQAKTLDVEANMAIDRGLWYLHKQMSFQQAVPAGVYPYRYIDGDGVAIGYQVDQSGPASTASMVQAMEINNHRESGNRLIDPYVDDVARGLAYITAHLFPQGIGVQPAGDPDTNGNGIGLYADGGSAIYVTGQLADALVASGTPNAIARTGDATWVKGRTYKALVQDMMDMYWWAQADLVDGWGNPNPKRGGWRYGMNDQDSDASTAQWAAIAGLAGRDVWGIPVPQFVYTQNLEGWLKFDQSYDGTGTGADGRFGYENAGWVFSNGMADTPSGLVQMIFDGVNATTTPATDDERRFQAALKYMARTWSSTQTLHNEMNIYGMFATAKVMRLAKPSPILSIGDAANGVADFDWYRSDPVIVCTIDPGWGGQSCTPPDRPYGLARDLINNQTADGAFHAGNWVGTTLGTDYAIIILSPTIFDLGATAVCNVNPNVVAIGGNVNFDGSGSFHNNTDGLHSVTGWSWNFTDGGTASGPTATHSFGALGTYHVQLTVTDNNGLTASTSCTVDVISGNLPPTVDIGGPYQFCAASPMVLTATATDPEGGPLSYAWDWNPPVNFNFVGGAPNATTATANFSGAIGHYDVGVRVTDDNGLVTQRFTTIDVVPEGTATCNTAPTVTVPADITTPATAAGGATVEFTATAVDAEDPAVVPVCTPASGSLFPIGPTTVTCTATDSGGLSSSKTFTVTVTNNLPSISVPADIVTAATSALGAAVSFDATGSDVEDISLVPSCTFASGSVFGIGTTTVSCTVTDSYGETATDTFTVTVLNNPPVISVPGDITTPATSAAGAPVVFGATATDVEDVTLTPTCIPASGSTFVIGTTTVICTATDSHTVTATGTFTVTVTNTAPTISVPANQTLEATSSAGAVATFVVTTDDAEQGAIAPVCSAASGSPFALGTTTVTCKVTDFGGLSASGSFTITVVDTTGPVFAVSDVTVAATSAAGASATYAFTATDAVDGPVAVSCVPASGATFAIGTNSVSCTATDAASNATTHTFNVTVTNTAPTITVPPSQTLEATSSAGAVATFVVTTDDAEQGAIAPVCSAASGSPFALGTTTVTCTVTDFGGLSASGSFTITVVDTIGPVFAVSDVTVAATSAAGASATFAFTATDAVDGPVAVSCVPASGATFAIGTNAVSCTATDAAGNPTTHTFNVKVTNTGPTISVPANQTLEATSSAGAVATFVVTTDDAEQGAIAPVCSAASGSTFALGTTTVTCTVTDFGNLSASGTFTITVVDTTGPAFAVSDVTVAATSAAGAPATYAFTALDAVDGPVAVVCVPASGATFAIGTNAVSCTATDAAGNPTTHTFNVKVTNTAPTIHVPPSQTLEATSSAGAIATFVVTTDDAEQGAIAPVCSAASGSTFALGTTTVTCTVTDFGNLSASGTFTITVVDTIGPVFAVSNLTLPATSPAGAVATYPLTATDAVDGNVAVICGPPSGTTFAIGTAPVSCTATDAAGNSTTHGFTVTVVQTNGAPTINVPGNMTVEATSSAGANVTFVVSANDPEQGAMTPACSKASGSTFPLGATTVTCSVKDSSGLSASGSFTVTVVDTTPPAFAVTNLVLHATSAAGAVATYAFTATDAVDGSVAVQCAPSSGTTFPIGTTTVNCWATDHALNRADRPFTVMVFNNAPVCSAAGPVLPTMWPPNHKMVPITLQGATDADGDALTITVTGIFQDEPINGVADGDTAPDGSGLGTSTAYVRSERAGNPKVPGDGRVYHIAFAVSDGRGGVCTVPNAIVGVVHDQSPKSKPPVDGGALFNSVTGAKNP